MAKKQTTAAEKRHLDQLAAMPCVLCDVLGAGPTRAEIHHIREGQGASQRASHWLAVPLCPECHRGSLGVHGNRSLLRMAKLEELDLLAITISKLQGRAA